jgi:hypothetical protein
VLAAAVVAPPVVASNVITATNAIIAKHFVLDIVVLPFEPVRA